MDKDIKLSQKIRSDVCKANIHSNDIDATINDLLDCVNTHIHNAYRPSQFIKMIITSLLTLSDGLYLKSIVFYNVFHKKEWYKVIGQDSKINRVLKQFLYTTYYDKNSNELLGSRQKYNYAILTFKNIYSKEKYSVIVCNPDPLTNDDKIIISKSVCYAFSKIFEETNLLNNIFNNGILVKKLLHLLNL